jgi:hypothetical protein
VIIEWKEYKIFKKHPYILKTTVISISSRRTEEFQNLLLSFSKLHIPRKFEFFLWLFARDLWLDILTKRQA